MAALWTRAVLVSVAVVALLALIVVAIVKPLTRNNYGTSTLYYARTLEYPDFCLRFVARKEHRDYTEYAFDILDRNGRVTRQEFSYNVSGFQAPQFFRLAGDLFLADMDFAEPAHDWHPGDELPQAKITIWDESSAKERRPDLLRDARRLEAWMKEQRKKK